MLSESSDTVEDMAKRDVDNVDPAMVPEPIQRAERWRVVGVKLRKNAPEIFTRVFEMLVSCEHHSDDEDLDRITESYL